VDVVSTVDLSVQVDDRGTTGKTAVRSNLGSTDPMVSTTSRGSLGQLIKRVSYCSQENSEKTYAGDVVLNRLARSGNLPRDGRNLGDGFLHALDTSNNRVSVGLRLKVRSLGDNHAECAVYSSSATRVGTATKVLGDSQRFYETFSKMHSFVRGGYPTSIIGLGTLNTCSPLDRTVDAVGSLDDFKSKRTNVWCRLSKNTGA
jgi:hypothetical protein